MTSLWAKKRSRDGGHYWLPLITHLIDAQNTINWLFNHWLSPGQRRLLTQRFSEDKVEKLVKFIGFTHDIGKATPAFQIKRSFDEDFGLDVELLEMLIRQGFTGLDDVNLSDSRKSQHARAGEALLDTKGVPESVTAIIGGHHGRPEDSPQTQQIDIYTANYRANTVTCPNHN